MDKGKVIGRTLAVAGIGIGMYFILILADLITFWWVYNKMTGALLGRSIDGNLAKISGILFAAFVMLLTHGLAYAILRRDMDNYVPKVALLFIVWFGVMYYFSAPYANSVYDIFTAEVRAKYYRDANNQIIKMPLDAKIGPEGQPLQPFDQKAAEEYKKQQEVNKNIDETQNIEKGAGWFSSLLGGSSQEDPPVQLDAFFNNYNLELWTEKIQFAPDRTVVHLAGKGITNNTASVPIFKTEDTYLSDESGKIYYLLREFGNYTVKVDQIVHFELKFQPIPNEVKRLRLRSGSFGVPLEIIKILAKAEKIDALPNQPASADTPRVDQQVTADSYPPAIYSKNWECSPDSNICTEDWIVGKQTQSYERPATSIWEHESTLEKSLSLGMGTKVKIISGVTIAQRHAGKVTKSSTYGTSSSGPALMAGQSIAMYDYVGDGCHNAWIERSFRIICGLDDLEPNFLTDVWYQISLQDNRKVWIKNISESFYTRLHLNGDFWQAIDKTYNPYLTNQERLDLVDALIAKGGDMNGPVPQHASTALESALRNNDLQLLEELIKRGLILKKDQVDRIIKNMENNPLPPP